MGSQPATARYTLGEELANSLTHGFGLLLAIAGLCGLMLVAGGVRETASCLVYGVTLILVYATSTLYHGVRLPRAKQLLRTLDHVAIFLLIAGS
jgi:hemolysin III